jgi:hypothetical protein
MSEFFKEYQASKKGKELIALLFPLNNSDREKNLVNYWKKYPNETTAVTEGFHYILKDLSENKTLEESLPAYDLKEEFIDVVVHEIVKQKNFFSYPKAEDFFNIIKDQSPAILQNTDYLFKCLNKKEKPSTKIKLPDVFDEAALKECINICSKAHNAFEEIKGILPSIRKSNLMILNSQPSEDESKNIELKIALETFEESKTLYHRYATDIAKGLPFINGLYKRFKDNLIIHKVYLVYLSKFLTSRETKFAVEKYIFNLAQGDFDFSDPVIIIEEKTKQKNGNGKQLVHQFKKELHDKIIKLECRYKKRQLMIEKAKGLPISKVIKALIELAEIDHIDIKTHILLAKMFAEYSKKANSIQKRTNFRVQALSHCKQATAGIDDYLTLQGIDKLQERDKERISFNKTIASIRLPLLK